MALTPEDVVNKRFQPTKFREGYDQDEVDDFLDEVVVELRRLNQENEELRQRLVASDSRINELQRNAAQGGFVQQQPEPVAAAPAAPVAPAFTGVDPNAIDPSNTNNLLQLARRLHEEHVKEGVEKRDALIAEGHATAARVVAEAETRQRAQLTSLDQERQSLEGRIDELRNFEREYRQKLKGYIESQLRELDSANMLTAGPSASAQPQPSAVPPTAAPTQPAPSQGGRFEANPSQPNPSQPTPSQAAAPTQTGPSQSAPFEPVPSQTGPSQAAPSQPGPSQAAPFEAAPPQPATPQHSGPQQSEPQPQHTGAQQSEPQPQHTGPQQAPAPVSNFATPPSQAPATYPGFAGN